jgi:hypothetical protein
VIVLWIAFGLVSLALYFANSMNFELRASDNRVSAMAADEAIDGAVRYLKYLVGQQVANGSNGVFLTLADFQCRAVPVAKPISGSSGATPITRLGRAACALVW